MPASIISSLAQEKLMRQVLAPLTAAGSAAALFDPSVITSHPFQVTVLVLAALAARFFRRRHRALIHRVHPDARGRSGKPNLCLRGIISNTLGIVG